jgi:hypothetical protein
MSPIPGTIVSEQQEEPVTLTNEMDSFLKEEAPKVDLDLKDEGESNKTPDTSKALVSTGDFTESVLKNDVTNLEMYIMNLINDDLPFMKFCEVIKTKLDFDPLEMVSQEDTNSVNYLISNYLKFSLKNCLEKKIDLPSNVSPILFDKASISDKTLSLMYDLFLYFIYFTQLRNMLKEKDYNPIQNRDLVTFAFKTIASPIAISGIQNIDENTLLSELTNRYRRYRENGVFDKLMADIKSKHSCEFDMPHDVLQKEASRIYNAINQNIDKLTIDFAFKKFSDLNLKLGYDDFKGNNIQEEQIKKIISVEFNFRKNGKVIYEEIEHANFDDVPSSILEKYDIKETKYDSTNLKRYIKEVCSEDNAVRDFCIESVKDVNYSYRDLRNSKIDFTRMPDSVLRAIFMWDIDRDQKITINYLHYRDSVNECSLTKDMVISLLTNIQDTIDIDFVDSFVASRDE